MSTLKFMITPHADVELFIKENLLIIMCLFPAAGLRMIQE